MAILPEDYRDAPTAENSPCEACKGLGWFSIGDCEDGTIENCEICEGTGIDEALE